LNIRVCESGSGGDSVEIHVENLGRRVKAPPVRIGKDTLNDLRDGLIARLDAYRQSKRVVKLHELAEAGNKVFQILSQRNAGAALKWKDLFEANSYVSHSVVHTTFECDVSFPFALLCSSAPRLQEYGHLVDKFVGTKAVIINSFAAAGENRTAPEYVSSIRPCTLAHAIDNSVPGAEEEFKYLQRLKGVRSTPCDCRQALLEQWADKASIIHFSSHHRFDQGEYVLTLSRGENFRAISDSPDIPPRDELPFIFMNGCNTGSIQPGNPDIFVRTLCPDRASGVLTTFHSIGGSEAAAFARLYYRKWLAGRFAVDALAQTKHSMIFDGKDFSAITYEFWEMPEVLRLYKDYN
jgi:hypothetical protein